MNYLTTLIEIMSRERMGVTYDHARSRLNITYRSAEGTAGHWVYECPLDLLLDRTRIDPETKRMLWPDLDVETASALLFSTHALEAIETAPGHSGTLIKVDSGFQVAKANQPEEPSGEAEN
jgi:hypothetical protein